MLVHAVLPCSRIYAATLQNSKEVLAVTQTFQLRGLHSVSLIRNRCTFCLKARIRNTLGSELSLHTIYSVVLFLCFAISISRLGLRDLSYN